jgi:RNA exonuclease 1
VTPKVNADPDAQPPAPPRLLADVLPALDSRLTALYTTLPPRTAFVVLSGHEDPRRMSALSTRRIAFENAHRAAQAGAERGMQDNTGTDLAWTTQDARDLEEAVEKARRGLVFVGVKA